MNRIDETRVIIPARMGAKEWQEWTERLHALHREIFGDTGNFQGYVIASQAAETKIAVFLSGGSPVGYCAAHRFEKEVRGRKVTVFRAEAGLLREYRGHNATFTFGFAEALHYRLRHPFREIVYLGTFVHPSIYRLMTKHFPVIYPNRRYPIPAATEALMCDLADAFHVPMTDPSDPFIREVGWVTQDSEAEQAAWRNADHPDARYFISRNPRYGEGKGLVTLIPMELSNLSAAFIKHLRLRGVTRPSLPATHSPGVVPRSHIDKI